MVDLHGNDKGNISLPLRLQTKEAEDGEDAKNKPTIINMQQTLYEIKITDTDNKITRLEERNSELEGEIEEVSDLFATTDAETAEEIAALKQRLSSETDNVENCKNRINELEDLRVQDRKSHEEKTEDFKKQYKETKINFVSQIKVLTAKINTLDDFKKTQSILQVKLKSNSEMMAKRAEEVKEGLEKIEKKFQFDIKMLKQEMYNCLLDLAAIFQVDVAGYLNFPMQKLMRENVMLKSNLLVILKEESLKKENNTNLKEMREERRKDIKAYSSDAKRNMIIMKIQSAFLKFLNNSCSRIEKLLSTIDIPSFTNEEQQWVTVAKFREEERKTSFHLAKIKVLLHKETIKISGMKYLRKKMDCKIKRTVETLYDLKYAITCILEGSEYSAEFPDMGYPQLLLLLQGIIRQGRLIAAVKSTETMSRPSMLGIIEDSKVRAEDIDWDLSIESRVETPRTLKSLETIRDQDTREEKERRPDDLLGDKLSKDTDSFEYTDSSRIYGEYEASKDSEFPEGKFLDVEDE